MAYETPLTIAEIVNDISANKYVLPSIQREFVWGTPQIERLFDSIMQGYPIGTLDTVLQIFIRAVEKVSIREN